jgi:hypothetical protein
MKAMENLSVYYAISSIMHRLEDADDEGNYAATYDIERGDAFAHALANPDDDHIFCEIAKVRKWLSGQEAELAATTG